MLRHLIVFACLAMIFCHSPSRAAAQIKVDQDQSLVRYGNVEVTRYQVGVKINAKRGAVRNVFAMVAVPLTCAEQEVELIDEEISEHVALDYRVLAGGGARQMLVRVPELPDRAEAQALLTFSVRTRVILPPEDPSELVIPNRPPREIKRFLGKSPYIETNHSKIKKLARQIFSQLESSDELATADESAPSASSATITDWQRVEAIYDHVQQSIKYVEGPDKSALATLRAGEGDCQNISALFVALCRTCKIPARIVWVHEHNYPEFCLADSEGKLHWFPCESSGMRAFGEMPLARVIMQKGDNFKVPERKKSMRYASDFMKADPAHRGVGKPSHQFIRQKL